MKKSQYRSERGNMLFLTICAIVAILIPLLILLHWGPQMIYGGRAQNVVEAAGLLAAKDLSRIVINDPNFGYVSLSNFAPVGKATRALDGEPLPVTGINTLVGTVRQNAIIADHLRNDTMKELVEADLEALDSTIDELNNKLSDALSDRTRDGQCFDIDGKAVKPLQNVEAFLKEKLPSNMQLESVTLTLGWLDGGSETTIAVPQPEHLAQVDAKDVQSGKYVSFRNYPVGNRDFTFAGVDTVSHLVAGRNFHEDDGKHICSVVRIECTLVPKGAGATDADGNANATTANGASTKAAGASTKAAGASTKAAGALTKATGASTNAAGALATEDAAHDYTSAVAPPAKVRCVACCQAFSLPDVATRGAMTVRFAGRPVPGLLSWKDFLTQRYFFDSKVTSYDVIGGDFPFNRKAHLQPSDTNVESRQPNTSELFAEHLYCWLRNGRTRPRIDSVLAMIDEPFRYCLNEVYTYEFAEDGTIVRKVVDLNRFTRPVTADGQCSAMADTRIHTGASAIIIFRDSVRRLGAESGQHGGQPLVGYPLTKPDGFIDYEQLALNFSHRKDYRDGLALDIEIGGTGDSTAGQDVDAMHTRTASRKI